MRQGLAVLINPARWGSRARKGAVWALAVALLVCGWRLGAHLSGRHLRQVSRELADVNLLVRNPVPNNAGTRVLIAQSTEEGVALSVLECGTKQKQTIYEVPERRIFTGSLLLLEWSPDDLVLAYAKPAKEKKQVLVLFNPSVGSSVANIKVSGLIKELRWMSPAAFCYLNNSNTISVVARDSHGKWKHTSRLARSGTAGQLASLSGNTIAWTEAGAIWTWNAGGGAAEQFWKPETNSLFSCHYSRDTGKFLVVLTGADAKRRIYSLGLRTKSLTWLADTPSHMIAKASWISAGEGFAFQSSDHFADSLVLMRSGSAAAETLFGDGDVMDFQGRAGKLFLYGSEGSDPPGIWECDVTTGRKECLFAAMPTPFSFSAKVSHAWGTITNNGRVMTYQVWKPAGGRGARHPLILTQTPYRWQPYPLAAASEGYWFATVNRKSWEEGLDTWEEDVEALYRELVREPGVDPKRVYLYGHSAETRPMSNLAMNRPELWKGMIMLTPSALPDFSRTRVSRILQNCGSMEAKVLQRMPALHADAAKNGVAMRLLVHPGTRHTAVSRATEQAKLENLAWFLRGD